MEVVLAEAPVNDAELALGVVDHNVLGFKVAVHDAKRVAEVESLQDLEHIVADVLRGEGGVELAEINGVDILKNEDGDLGGGLEGNVEETDDVGSAKEVLKDGDLSVDLLALHGLEALDDARLAVEAVPAAEDLAILPPANLLLNLVGLDGTPVQGAILIVPKLLRHVLIDECVGVEDARLRRRLLYLGHDWCGVFIANFRSLSLFSTFQF